MLAVRATTCGAIHQNRPRTYLREDSAPPNPESRVTDSRDSHAWDKFLRCCATVTNIVQISISAQIRYSCANADAGLPRASSFMSRNANFRAVVVPSSVFASPQPTCSTESIYTVWVKKPPLQRPAVFWHFFTNGCKF